MSCNSRSDTIIKLMRMPNQHTSCQQTNRKARSKTTTAAAAEVILNIIVKTVVVARGTVHGSKAWSIHAMLVIPPGLAHLASPASSLPVLFLAWFLLRLLSRLHFGCRLLFLCSKTRQRQQISTARQSLAAAEPDSAGIDAVSAANQQQIHLPLRSRVRAQQLLLCHGSCGPECPRTKMCTRSHRVSSWEQLAALLID